VYDLPPSAETSLFFLREARVVFPRDDGRHAQVRSPAPQDVFVGFFGAAFFGVDVEIPHRGTTKFAGGFIDHVFFCKLFVDRRCEPLPINGDGEYSQRQRCCFYTGLLHHPFPLPGLRHNTPHPCL